MSLGQNLIWRILEDKEVKHNEYIIKTEPYMSQLEVVPVAKCETFWTSN